MVLDVAIIGAGISGINTAYRVQEALPDATYKLFEGRDEIGGTWTFFRYPGLRSDSDLYSFGFEWNPWHSDTVIADAASINEYLDRSMRSFGADKHLEMGHKLVSLDWSTEEQLWTLTFQVRGEEVEVQARWVTLGTGYYDYTNPLDAPIPGLDRFKGRIIHPQFWPEDLDVTGKKIAVIGSGATAVTILPNIAQAAEHVTLIQRSPSYIAARPKVDRMADLFKRWLPLSLASRILRLKYLLLSYVFYNYCQRFPDSARANLEQATKALLPKNIGIEPHFKPSYKPWDQRLCLSPDGDFYAALRSGKASIVTGHIESMSSDTISIKDQPESKVEADIVVTATGLRLLVGGGAEISIDGNKTSINRKMLWKGCMLSDIPNLIAVIGYTNASWTLGADVAAKTFTRLIRETRRRGASSATPVRPNDGSVNEQPFMRMNSSYLLKGRGDMPSAGNVFPWLPRSSYFADMWDASWGSVTKDIIGLEGCHQTLRRQTFPDARIRHLDRMDDHTTPKVAIQS